MEQALFCVPRFRINEPPIVPPIIVAMSKNPGLLRKFDLNSVKEVIPGGAPLVEEALEALKKYYPYRAFRQA